MIWLFKIDEVFWNNKPKVNEFYTFDVDDINFDITEYDISLYMATANYFLLDDINPGEIYSLQYSGKNSNPSRLLVDKNTDYYNAVSNYYQKELLQDRIDKIEAEIKRREQELLNISDAIKSLLPNKCEYCGSYDGIHRTDCSFMRRYW